VAADHNGCMDVCKYHNDSLEEWNLLIEDRAQLMYVQLDHLGSRELTYLRLQYLYIALACRFLGIHHYNLPTASKNDCNTVYLLALRREGSRCTTG
jgi:hypothetical protein